MKKESAIHTNISLLSGRIPGDEAGKTLWLIILVKLFIMFFILRLFFFPNYLGQFDSDSEKENHVSNELIQRAINP